MGLFNWLFAAKITLPPEPLARHFLADLLQETSKAGDGAYGFPAANGGWRGFVQFIPRSPEELCIHRLWTDTPGRGHGTHMLRRVCALADRHRLLLSLKVAPIGNKPYPMSASQLTAWYERYGFVRRKKWMLRQPYSKRFQDTLDSPSMSAIV